MLHLSGSGHCKRAGCAQQNRCDTHHHISDRQHNRSPSGLPLPDGKCHLGHGTYISTNKTCKSHAIIIERMKGDKRRPYAACGRDLGRTIGASNGMRNFFAAEIRRRVDLLTYPRRKPTALLPNLLAV
jgi:hypothetical protein